MSGNCDRGFGCGSAAQAGGVRRRPDAAPHLPHLSTPPHTCCCAPSDLTGLSSMTCRRRLRFLPSAAAPAPPAASGEVFCGAFIVQGLGRVVVGVPLHWRLGEPQSGDRQGGRERQATPLCSVDLGLGISAVCAAWPQRQPLASKSRVLHAGASPAGVVSSYPQRICNPTWLLLTD